MDVNFWRDYSGARCRFWLAGDGGPFVGWISDFSGNQVCLKCPQTEGISVGNVVRFEVEGRKATASFEATLSKTDGEMLWFEIAGAVRFSHMPNPGRRIARGVQVVIKGGEKACVAEALDVSSGGIGILCEFDWPARAEVSLGIKMRHGVIPAIGIVRYCQEVTDTPGKYRVGIQFKQMDRLDKARWERYVDQAA